MSKSKIIDVNGTAITIYDKEQKDYISLTDIAKYRNPAEPFSVINNWMRSRSTIEFIGLWEKLCNPIFKPLEFERFKNEAGSNYFVLSPQRWIEATNAIGIISKSGRYGGTFAHKDIAFEFASWISSEFKLYLVVEFQRLKEDENDRLKLDWNLQRTLAKVNYHIHTDAIKENLIPKELNKTQVSFVYANEADMLNVALFGKTAKQWRDDTSTGPVPKATGNIRDEATIEQLVVLSNMESINAVFIGQGLSQSERLLALNKMAITQMKSLLNSAAMKKLK
jgi:KilA-N domain